MSKRTDLSRLRKNHSLHFQIGLIFSISFALLAFSWTVPREAVSLDNVIVEIPEDIPIERTAQPEPKLPPPPVEKPEKIELVEELPMEPTPIKLEKPEPKPIEVSIDQVVKVKPPEPKKPVKLTPIPKEIEEEEEPKEAEIFIFVEQMPEFPGCDAALEGNARKTCSDRKVMEYIQKRIKYPAIARENNIQGFTMIQFVVNEDGSISDLKVVKPLGGGCSKEALRVIKTMPKWIPGKQRNQAVKVRFNMPVHFRLADG